MTKRALANLAALILSVGAAAGCDPIYNCNGQTLDVAQAACEVGGGGRVTSTTFAVSETLEAMVGNSCLAASGQCSDRPRIILQTQKRQDGHSLNIGIEVAPTDGPGTYAMTGDKAANVFGTLSDNTNVHSFTVTSGELVVTRNDASAFEATFHMDLVSDDGHRFSVTGGNVDVDSCEVLQVPTCTDGPSIDFGNP
jgi:hypothetical protein